MEDFNIGLVPVSFSGDTADTPPPVAPSSPRWGGAEM